MTEANPRSRRGGDRSAQARAAGKRMGRPPKQKIPRGTKCIATEVLGLLGANWRGAHLPSEKDVWLSLLLAKGNDRLRFDAIKYLTDRRDGLASQRIENVFDPETPLRITVEHIGRPQDQTAAEAKFIGGTVE